MSPDELIAVVAASQYGVFNAQQARAAGFTRHAICHRVRTGRWRRLSRGVYAIAGVPDTPEQRVVAAMLRFGSLAVAASRTAAWLHGLLETPGDLVYLLMPPGQHRVPPKGTAVGEAALMRSDVRTVRGVRVTAPNRTLVDLAGVLPERSLEAVLDDAILAGLTTAPTLARYIVERRLENRPGVGVLRRLLNDRMTGVPQKELERMFLRKLRAAGLPEPERQVPCGRRRIDFAYPDVRLAIELDGRAPHFTGRAFREDPRRQNELVLAGYTVLRFTWDDIAHGWAATEAVLRSTLDARVTGRTTAVGR